MIRHGHPALLTDLYQLTMLQGYFMHNMNQLAVFEFFVRDLPEERNFLMAAGLEQVLDFLERIAFDPDEVDWLASTGMFNQQFLSHLEKLRFTGDVHALPEGTVFFPDEPIVRVTAPIPQAQLVETRLINIVHFQTLVASKAARMVLAAPNKLLVDFGLRRAHGAEAGLMAARASYLAGFAGSSTVLAGRFFDIPIYGTMAHSFIQAHDTEIEAFEHFALAQPDNVVLLIDTYDTEAAAEKIVTLVAPRLKEKGIPIKAVRLDSGDLVKHSRKVRAILDQGGLGKVRIFTSGNLDEYALNNFVRVGAPIDGFGVGTRMVTSSDKPYLDCAYKLEEYAGIPRRKRSEGKATWPGRKQVYRNYSDDGKLAFDMLTLDADSQQGQPLLQHVMKDGKRVAIKKSLIESREHALKELKKLPANLRQLDRKCTYPVMVSDGLQNCTREVDTRNTQL